MSKRDIATRRRFLARAGAALAAPAALAAAGEATAAGRGDSTLEARLAALEDASAIRALQRAYVRHLNARDTDAIAEVCAVPQRVALDAAVQELAPHSHEDAIIAVAADRLTATARLPCTVRIETPIEAPGCTLVEMARLQGEGVVRRTERRVLEQWFVRGPGVSQWRIERTVLRQVADA